MKKELFLKDIFTDLPIQRRLNVLGKQMAIPTKYVGEVYMATFSVSTKKSREKIKTNKLTPIEIGIGRSLISVTIFNYKSAPIGPYIEVAFSIPVLYKSKFSAPLVSLLFRDMLKNFGFYAIILATNNLISKKGSEVFGYTLYDKDIEVLFNKTEKYKEVAIKEAGQEIMKLQLNNLKRERIERKDYNTYLVNNNRLNKVVMNTIGVIGRSMKPGCGKISFSNYGVASLLSDMDIDRNAIEASYYSNLIEVLNIPEDLEGIRR